MARFIAWLFRRPRTVAEIDGRKSRLLVFNIAQTTCTRGWLR